MRDDQRDDVVRLTTASNPALAHIWQQALQDEGINCEVVGDYLNAGLGDMPGMQAELWVHQNDVERAQAILQSHMTAAEQEKGDEET
jgi:kynureninase